MPLHPIIAQSEAAGGRRALYGGDDRGDELEEEDQVAAGGRTYTVSTTVSCMCSHDMRQQGISEGQHLSTFMGLPLDSARPMSLRMTPACLQGWMEAEGTPVFGKGSTVMVLRACSSLTSSRICAHAPLPVTLTLHTSSGPT